MADEKISDMPGTSEVSNSDILPIVQGGVNKQCGKSSFLQAAPGESITIASADGSVSVRIDTDGTLRITTNGVMFLDGLPTSDPGNPGQWFVAGNVLTQSTG